MREGWISKTLGEVTVPSGTVDPRKKPSELFLYVDVSNVSKKTYRIVDSSEMLGKEAPSRARRQMKSGDVLFATIRPTLQRIAQVPDSLDGQVCSTGYFVFRPRSELDSRFLYYYLFTSGFTEAMESLQSGASYPAVNDKQVKQQRICFPPLPEQKRIVAILDEAFEGIDRAAANTQKNLANARELFESYLNSIFRQGGEDWMKTTLGMVCSFEGGSQPPKAEFSKERKKGYLRLIQIRDYKSDNHIVYIPREKARRFCSKSDVMIGRYGPPLFQILRGIEGSYNVALMKAVPDESQISKSFVYYFLKNGDILRYIIASSNRAAGQIGLNKATLEPYPISFPCLKEQTRIVLVLDGLLKDIQSLEEVYKKKLSALAEMKQSVLQKAFTGELTQSTPQAVLNAIETIPADTKSPAFAANIIAIGFDTHASNLREKTWGRVKAQKTLQLTESAGSIDMGREPIKDAAGPNDSAHMRKAENWAKAEQFFEFIKRGKGYQFKKLARYGEMIDEAQTMLAPYRDALDRVTDLVLPMDSKETEIFATIHAAWNNLILDDVEVSDEAVIHEARENWHTAKMDIPVSKFREAIRQIRKEGFIPDGSAKRVGDGQGSLL